MANHHSYIGSKNRFSQTIFTIDTLSIAIEMIGNEYFKAIIIHHTETNTQKIKNIVAIEVTINEEISIGNFFKE